MRYLKMLGLLAVAAAAMMAFAGSASAALATSPPGTLYTGTVKASAESELTMVGDNVTVTCTSSEVQGKITVHRKNAKNETLNASIPIEKLTFTGCGQHVEDPAVTPGTLLITSAGTVFSSGLRLTATFTSFFGSIHCVYITNNTHFGTLTDAPSATGHATIDVQAAIPVDPTTNGGGICGSSWTWGWQYKVASPTGLVID